jgi:hypothetical protein
MSDDDDIELKQRFHAQRQQIEVGARSWEESWSAAAAEARRAPVTRARWKPLVAAAAVVTLSALLFVPRSSNQELQDAVPPLFEASAAGEAPSLFAFGPPSSRSSWPSDSLNPTHLNLIIP